MHTTSTVTGYEAGMCLAYGITSIHIADLQLKSMRDTLFRVICLINIIINVLVNAADCWNVEVIFHIILAR